MNSFVSKLVAFFLGIFLLIYAVYQSFVLLYDPYEAEMVNAGVYIETVDVEGFFVRDESVIDVRKSGIIDYSYRNAQKIPNDSAIAKVYTSEQDLYNLKKLDDLKSKYDILKGLSTSNEEVIKLDLLNSKISALRLDVVRQVDDCDFSDIEETAYDLMLNLGKSAMFVDETVNYENTIAELESEIALLEGKIPEPSDIIISENSGFFSSSTDGYESRTGFDMLESLSVGNVADILMNPTTADTGNIGKLVNETFWYFVSIVPVNNLEMLNKAYNKNAIVTLKFDSKASREVKSNITSIIQEDGNNNAVVVFKSYEMDEDLINMRFETPQVIVGQHSGVILPKEAIRMQDGYVKEDTGEVADRVKGVYTQFGKSTRFKLVDIVFEDDYVVVSRVTPKNDYVANYDKIIVKGKALDGKTVK